MSAWSRDSVTSRLIRNSSYPELKPNPHLAQPPSLQDRFFPIRTSLPSYIRSDERDNQFELKPQYINTLPKFHGFESDDAHFFIREFEKVCLMMKIANLRVDAVKLHFVPFSLKGKEIALQSKSGSISSWDNFIKAVLKKFYPVHKTTQIRKSILQFKQTANEPFQKYFECFKDHLSQCLTMG